MKRKIASLDAGMREAKPPKRIKLGSQIEVYKSAQALKEMSPTLYGLLQDDGTDCVDLSDTIPYKNKGALQTIKVYLETSEISDVKSNIPEVIGNSLYLGNEDIITSIIEQVRNDEDKCVQMVKSENLCKESVPEKCLLRMIEGKKLYKHQSYNGQIPGIDELTPYGNLIERWSANSDRVESLIAKEKQSIKKSNFCIAIFIFCLLSMIRIYFSFEHAAGLVAGSVYIMSILYNVAKPLSNILKEIHAHNVLRFSPFITSFLCGIAMQMLLGMLLYWFYWLIDSDDAPIFDRSILLNPWFYIIPALIQVIVSGPRAPVI